MSIDNGIFILHLADGYRVIGAQRPCFQNLTYNCVFDMDTFNDVWKNSLLILSKEEAMKKAKELLQMEVEAFGICEYGIYPIIEMPEIDISKIPEYENCNEEQKTDYYPFRPWNDAAKRGAYYFVNHFDDKTWTAKWPDGREEIIVNHIR